MLWEQEILMGDLYKIVNSVKIWAMRLSKGSAADYYPENLTSD